MTDITVRSTSISHPQLAAPQTSTSSAPGAEDDTSSTHIEDIDAASDRDTAAFIRRVLCSYNVLLSTGERGRSSPRPIEEVLPPLTSSNAVDLQLYAIISVIIKEFVQTWYSKITPDQDFIHEVIQVIAHCTRGLEQRLRKVDLEALIFDEIPELLEAHLIAYQLAKKEADSPTSLVSDLRVVYHTLHPHPALSPVPSEATPSSLVEQRENESAWRQLLVQGLLAVLLPTEDLENGCLRSLVAEIFAEMILGNGISGKACESWLLWEGLTRIAEVLQHDAEEEELQSGHIPQEQPLSSLERYGLLSAPIGGQSGLAEPSSPTDRHHAESWFSISGAFWAIIHYAFLVFATTRTLVIGIAKSSSLSGRSVDSVSISSPIDANRPRASLEAEQPAAGRPVAFKRPIVDMKLWSCASQIVEMRSRMPWLSGFVSMLHWMVLAWPGRVGDTDGVLDRWLSYTIQKRVLNPALVPVLLRTVRVTLFPNNALGPARQPPSADEAKAIKQRCAERLLGLIPATVAKRFLATDSEAAQLQQVGGILDCLDDTYLNKHLIFQIVELIILRLVPELGERGVSELLDERLG